MLLSIRTTKAVSPGLPSNQETSMNVLMSAQGQRLGQPVCVVLGNAFFGQTAQARGRLMQARTVLAALMRSLLITVSTLALTVVAARPALAQCNVGNLCGSAVPDATPISDNVVYSANVCGPEGCSDVSPFNGPWGQACGQFVPPTDVTWTIAVQG